jgi:phosphatidate cytidylyltransferase
VLPLLWFSNIPFFLNVVVGLVAVMAVYEALVVTKYIEGKELRLISLLVAFTMPIIPALVDRFGFIGLTIDKFLTIGAFVFTVILFATLIKYYEKFSLEHIAVVFLLSVILSFFFTTLIYVRMIEYVGLDGKIHSFGAYYIYFVFVGAWMTDTAAYVWGRLFGKHQLAKKISPKKTVEGAVGAVITTTLAFIVTGYIIQYFFNRDINYIYLIITGILAALAALLGDLVASVIKRTFKVKDFGSILPGHGGILDRFDSVIFVSPLLYVIFSTFKIVQ